MKKKARPLSVLHIGWMPALSPSGLRLRLASHMFKSGIARLKGQAVQTKKVIFLHSLSERSVSLVIYNVSQHL